MERHVRALVLAVLTAVLAAGTVRAGWPDLEGIGVTGATADPTQENVYQTDVGEFGDFVSLQALLPSDAPDPLPGGIITWQVHSPLRSCQPASRRRISAARVLKREQRDSTFHKEGTRWKGM